MRVSLEQHNVEIHENRRHWERKPLLRKVYAQFGREIAKRVDHTQPGLIVELGSGMGNIKQHLPGCITTDVFPNPWLDRVENAYDLAFADGSVSHMVLFDVWHHLEYPGTALREFYRVLTGHGKVIIFDPAMGVLGRFVFGNFHHEPLGLNDKIRWEAPESSSRHSPGYYAAQGNASRVFGSTAFQERLRSWRVAEVAYFSALAYLGSGGLRGPQLYPMSALPLLNRVDSFLSRFPILASRMLVVLEKQADSGGRSDKVNA
jgi:SAM-dependent methyltransferase